jgi:hypothetical protein
MLRTTRAMALRKFAVEPECLYGELEVERGPSCTVFPKALAFVATVSGPCACRRWLRRARVR